MPDNAANNQQTHHLGNSGWFGYAATVVLEAAFTVALILLEPYFPLSTYPIYYVVIVLAAAYYWGEGPAILAFFMGLILADYFFIEPRQVILPLANSLESWAKIFSLIVGSMAVGAAVVLMRRSKYQAEVLAHGLQASEEMFRQLAENIHEVFWLSTPDWSKMLYVSPAYEEIWGSTCDNVYAEPLCWVKAIIEEDRQRVTAELAKAQSAPLNEAVHWEYRLVRPDDSIRWVSTRAFPVRDSDGLVYRLAGIVEDITDRKAAEDTRAKLAAIVETSEDAIIGKDLDGIITSWNVGATKLYGYTPDEVVGRSISFLVPHNHPDDVPAILRKIKRGESVGNYETQRARKDGTIADVSLTVSILTDSSGNIVGASTIARDITELVRLRNALQNQVILLQRALLPRIGVVHDGYRIASLYQAAYAGEAVGGDFYDALLTQQGNIGLVIGDVSGKGVEVASLAAASRSTIRAFLYEIPAISVCLTHTNSVLRTQQVDPNTFVTMFVAMIDPDTGVLTYARAGHPPAVIWRTNGTVEFLEVNNPPIAIFDKIAFRSANGHLGPGDKMVFYTDGIIESRKEQEFFDLEGIRRVLMDCGYYQPSELANELLRQSADWAGGKHSDDAAIVILERLEKNS